MASINQIPEKIVEYIESIRTEIESQLAREECISWFVGHPSRRPGELSKASKLEINATHVYYHYRHHHL
jgi:hypothetical protein